MKPEEDPPQVFFISKEQVGIRLDKLLSLQFPDHSRSYFQFLIEQGSVLVNTQPVKKRSLLKEGDEVEVLFILTPELTLTPQPIPLSLLYEDEYLLAINKPPDMVVHPAPGHPKDTFANALIHHCQSLQNSDSLRPGIVHRLDKETSGVLLAAKTLQAQSKLAPLFSSRSIQKHYLAICSGVPQEGVIDLPIGRHPTLRKQMHILPEGKPSQSLIEVLHQEGSFSLVHITPHTGRTHQIRVHLKHLGAPVLGDSVYGASKVNTKLGTQRQLLHAHRLEFIHPFTQKKICLTAPLPSDFTHFATRLHLQS